MEPLEVTIVNGQKFYLPLFDPVVARRINDPSSMVPTLLTEINGGVYAPLFQNRKDLTFLDIGANIGLVSIYAYPACSRIISVEPDPGTFEVLKAMTFALTKIERVQAALAMEDGQVEFYQNGLNTTASSTVNTFGKQIHVRGLTLSSILSIYQLEHVDVLKCDAEGAEGESLTFEQLQIASPVVDSWYIEVHNIPGVTWETTMARIEQDLIRLGYGSITRRGMSLWAIK